MFVFYTFFFDSYFHCHSKKMLVRSVRTCVCEEVGLEVGPLVEAPLANGTFVGGLLHVQDLVHGQGSGLTEPLAALCTLEGLFLGVDVAVVPQMILPAEGLATQVTRVGPLVCVGALMYE